MTDWSRQKASEAGGDISGPQRQLWIQDWFEDERAA